MHRHTNGNGKSRGLDGGPIGALGLALAGAGVAVDPPAAGSLPGAGGQADGASGYTTHPASDERAGRRVDAAGQPGDCGDTRSDQAAAVDSAGALLAAVAAARDALSRGQQLTARRAELAGEAETLATRREALEREARSQVQPVEAALEQARPLVGLGLVAEAVFEAARRDALTAFERLTAEAQPLERRLAAVQAEIAAIETDGGYRAAERIARAESEGRNAIERALRLAKAGDFAAAGRVLGPVADDPAVPPALRRQAQGYRDEVRHLAAQAEVDARRRAAEARVTAAQRARAAIKRAVRAWRADRYAEAERLLAPPSGDDTLPDDLRAQARGLLWQVWLSESEALAQPGDERYSLPGGLFMLRDGAVAAVWGQTPYAPGTRVGSLAHRARRKPWPPRVAKRLAPAAAIEIDVEELIQALVTAVARTAAGAVVADLDAAVVKPVACRPSSPDEVAVAPDAALCDYLAGLLAAGCEVDLDDRATATVVLVQTPDGREVTAEARLRRTAAPEQQRLRAEKLVRDLQARLGDASQTADACAVC